jgi:O-antigen ligase
MATTAHTTDTGLTQAPLDRLLFWLACATLALAPSQLTFTVKSIPLTPAEMMLLLAALVWAVRWFTRRDTSSLPPWPHWMMITAAVMGIFIAGDRPQMSILKDAAQTVLYLIIGVTIFRAALADRARLRTATVALLVGTTFAVGLGVAQWAILQRDYQPNPMQRVVFGDRAARSDDPEDPIHAADHLVFGVHDATGFHPQSRYYAYLSAETPLEVSSTFGNWNKHGYHASRTAYAGFLALVLPLALALVIGDGKRRGIVIWVAALGAGIALSVLAGLVLPALLTGVLVTAGLLGRKVLGWAAAALLGYLALTALLPFNRQEMLIEPTQMQISQADADYLYPPAGIQQLKKFWGEQQAALNVLRYHPLFGVGVGNYQQNISSGYDRLSVVDKQRLEADAQNGYLLWAVSTGVLGLAALCWLFGSYLLTAWRAARAKRDPWSAALAGAMTALVVLSLVTNPWVRGTAILVAALLGALGALATPCAEERMTNKEEL